MGDSKDTKNISDEKKISHKMKKVTDKTPKITLKEFKSKKKNDYTVAGMSAYHNFTDYDRKPIEEWESLYDKFKTIKL